MTYVPPVDARLRPTKGLSYISPRQVNSPKVSISSLKPIIDRGEWDYSAALLHWERQPRVAIRWNGGTEDGRIHPGNPQSRGLPTWFILPQEYEIAFLNQAVKRGLGGGEIDLDDAKKAVQEALSRRNAPAVPDIQTIDDAKLEAAIIQVITRLKAEGKI